MRGGGKCIGTDISCDGKGLQICKNLSASRGCMWMNGNGEKVDPNTVIDPELLAYLELDKEDRVAITQ